MNQYNCKIKSNKFITSNTFLIECISPELAQSIKPGQFCNIRISDAYTPLLRRPFSISNVKGDSIFFMISIHGNGTKLLSEMRVGDFLSVLGPLGNGFNYADDFDLGIIVSGGIGIAPFPFLTQELKHKNILSYLGFRNKNEIITDGLKNCIIATDDGSQGFEGNVIELLKSEISNFKDKKLKVFACGPTPMLRAVKYFCEEYSFNCEISTESAMACGFGICQGCPIDSTHGDDKYLLICKDGPVFNSKDVII